MKKHFVGYIVVCVLAVLGFSAFCLADVTPTQVLSAEPAYAAIKVGSEELNGYEPADVIQVDERYTLDASNASGELESVVVRLIKMIMPILMVVCVGLIVYNAARNIVVRKPEEQVKMGDLIKKMFVNFFFILFAWIIVEGIVFIVTSGELLFFSIVLG